jgi:hypothetical protein
MLDSLDVLFKNAMERELVLLLDGDNDSKGLYEQALSSQDWDTFNRSKGAIEAYENVRKMMTLVARRMSNEDDEPMRLRGR